MTALAKGVLDRLISIRDGASSNSAEELAKLARLIRPPNITRTEYDPVSRRVTSFFVDGNKYTSDIDVSQECFDSFIKE